MAFLIGNPAGDVNRSDHSSDSAVEPPDVGDSGDNGDGDRWVTVAAFSFAQEAHIARLRLESDEIDCFLIDENLVATDWLLANAVGGIKVQVRESDVSRARDILGARAVLPDDPNAGASAAKNDSEDAPVACPSCGSTDTALTWFSRRLFFLGVLIGLPVPLPMRIRRCIRCRHEWKHRPGFSVTSPGGDNSSGE